MIDLDEIFLNILKIFLIELIYLKVSWDFLKIELYWEKLPKNPKKFIK